MKKVGIMGGTFNPIHMGHLILAECARTQYALDEILFIPSGNSYMKKGVLDCRKRLQMTSLAIEDNPNFALSTLEVERDGNTYTYETLQLLHEQYPDTEFYFILGADSLFMIEQWRNPELIMQQCVLLAAIREGYEKQRVLDKIAELQEHFHADVRFVSIHNIELSSSDLRERVKNQDTIRYMVPDKVLDYIIKNNLYVE